ncbi:hypothetical protein FA09DRAFT_287386, partial [Tilletiopsis washingtonensis]
LFAQAKAALAQHNLLCPPSGTPAAQLVQAREVLELGALDALRRGELAAFDRYIGLLGVFWDDFRSELPPSSAHEPLLGLSLLRLLSSNRISQFHTVLETLDAALVGSRFIQHPVLLERWLMEGSYSKVWRARDEVPQPEYAVFIEMLMRTIRHEIASCEEKAYDSLPLGDAATLLFFDNMQDVSAFAGERGWQINPSTQTVHFANKLAGAGARDAIPKKETIVSNLQFAKELESIV